MTGEIVFGNGYISLLNEGDISELSKLFKRSVRKIPDKKFMAILSGFLFINNKPKMEAFVGWACPSYSPVVHKREWDKLYEKYYIKCKAYRGAKLKGAITTFLSELDRFELRCRG